ncbi:metal-dependent hydrolase [Bacillus sp. CMF21]|uniref:metal-dependent hydrolase n=1 Tax=Metabacillus dongyingensis TaxID=2874282 RepID=UPI001CBFC65D|nr:metal-dependent hydrolase [Metabacillus dongyingensis]UAL52899.1 metal-dependent hydrolase [Metabacillus dongyingensis]USK29218.1 metal-dependent hydrolase [Bacillus sp. CMF21]
MDTGTHVVMGIALGGLATLDPAVGTDPVTAQAVMIGAIAGSQAPDLDTVLKFRNNAKYIRNHRGITHSIPAVILWSVLITALLYWIIPRADLLHLAVWTSVAVVLHVFVDIFNAYGTQALRPFSKKWIALGMINTFDPILFLIYTAGIVVWIFGTPAGYTFLTVFIVAFGYYILRFIMKRRIVHKIHEKYGDVEKIIISPTMKFRKWRIAIISKNHYYVGRSLNNELTILDEYDRVPVPQTDVIQAAEQDENISAFLSFSPVYRWEVDEYTDHYEVKFIDLRYRSKGHYPFVAIVQLDQDLNIVSSYTGWIFSEEKLRKKLDLLPE